MITSYKMKNGEYSTGRICTLKDLQIFEYDDVEQVALLDKDTTLGIDFFLTEEKTDA